MLRPTKSLEADSNFRDLLNRLIKLERRVDAVGAGGTNLVSGARVHGVGGGATSKGIDKIEYGGTTNVGTTTSSGTSKKVSRSSHIHKDYQLATVATYSSAVINLGTTDDGGTWTNVDATNAVIATTTLAAGYYNVWFQFPWHGRFQDSTLFKYVGCAFAIYDGTTRKYCNEVMLYSTAGSANDRIVVPVLAYANFYYSSQQALLTWYLQKIAMINAGTVNNHEILCDGTNNRCLTKGYQWT
jgi:hypothetical protein